MEHRFEEIAQERAVIAAKPASLVAEIERGDEVRIRLVPNWKRPKRRWPRCPNRLAAPMPGWPNSPKRFQPHAKPAPGPPQAENEETRREEMARISGFDKHVA